MIAPPSKATLKKYGLSYDDWLALYNEQSGKCSCGRVLEKRTCIDHFHVKGWKKMKPDERKKYVRGLTHWQCNFYFLRKGMTADVARGIAKYLDKFDLNRLKRLGLIK